MGGPTSAVSKALWRLNKEINTLVKHYSKRPIELGSAEYESLVEERDKLVLVQEIQAKKRATARHVTEETDRGTAETATLVVAAVVAETDRNCRGRSSDRSACRCSSATQEEEEESVYPWALD